MQSKRLHKESFLWNDLFHDKNKSEPIANRRKVRIYSLWWTIGDSNPGPTGYEPVALTNCANGPENRRMPPLIA